MSYSLWSSDDTRYTLGFRIGRQARVEAPRENEPGVPAPQETLAVDRVHLVIARLSRQSKTSRAAG